MAFTKFPKSDDDNNGDPQELAEINMIPLVDIMLVLLIVFMVAAPLSITGITVQLPKTAARGDQVEESRIILTINKEGDFYLDKLQIQDKSLKEKLRSIFEHRKKKELYIRADSRVKYGQVVFAMGAAKLAGVAKMSMLTTPDAASSSASRQ